MKISIHYICINKVFFYSQTTLLAVSASLSAAKRILFFISSSCLYAEASIELYKSINTSAIFNGTDFLSCISIFKFSSSAQTFSSFVSFSPSFDLTVSLKSKKASINSLHLFSKLYFFSFVLIFSFSQLILLNYISIYRKKNCP